MDTLRSFWELYIAGLWYRLVIAYNARTSLALRAERTLCERRMHELRQQLKDEERYLRQIDVGLTMADDEALAATQSVLTSRVASGR